MSTPSLRPRDEAAPTFPVERDEAVADAAQQSRRKVPVGHALRPLPRQQPQVGPGPDGDVGLGQQRMTVCPPLGRVPRPTMRE